MEFGKIMEAATVPVRIDPGEHINRYAVIPSNVPVISMGLAKLRHPPTTVRCPCCLDVSGACEHVWFWRGFEVIYRFTIHIEQSGMFRCLKSFKKNSATNVDNMSERLSIWSD